MSELIQKSVRLPSNLVDFIEQQKGYTFSEKLVNLLEEDFYGAERRSNAIKEQNERLKLLQNRVNAYYELIHKTRTASRKYEDLIRVLEEDIDKLSLPFT